MMPSPWIGWRPYGKDHPAPRNPGDPFSWLVNEREQAFKLGPGLQLVASQVVPALQRIITLRNDVALAPPPEPTTYPYTATRTFEEE